jgi:hypothetical protein
MKFGRCCKIAQPIKDSVRLNELVDGLSQGVAIKAKLVRI